MGILALTPDQIRQRIASYDAKMPAVITSEGCVVSDITQEILENDPESTGNKILDLELSSSPYITIEQTVEKVAGPLTLEYYFASHLNGGGLYPAHLLALDVAFQINNFDIPGTNINFTVNFLDQNRNVIPEISQTITGTINSTQGNTRPGLRLFPFQKATAAQAQPAPGAGTYVAGDAQIKPWAVYNPIPIYGLVETDDGGGNPSVRPTDVRGVGAIVGIQLVFGASGVANGTEIVVTPITWGWRDAALNMGFALISEDTAYEDMRFPDTSQDSFLANLP